MFISTPQYTTTVLRLMKNRNTVPFKCSKSKFWNFSFSYLQRSALNTSHFRDRVSGICLPVMISPGVQRLFPFVPGMETEHLSTESQLICVYFMDIGKKTTIIFLNNIIFFVF
jgi:hypothetical protein